MGFCRGCLKMVNFGAMALFFWALISGVGEKGDVMAFGIEMACLVKLVIWYPFRQIVEICRGGWLVVLCSEFYLYWC